MTTFNVNGHTFEMTRNDNDIDVIWKSYMNLEFTFRIEPATRYEELNTGLSYFLNLTDDNYKTWKQISGFEFYNPTLIEDRIKNALYRFTETY